jgi:predicted lipoprotein
MEHLERVRDTELARPLGVTQNRRVLPGPFSESGLTMAFIAARVAGLHSLFVDTALAAELQKVAKTNSDADAKADVDQALFELRLLEQRSAELAKIPDVLGNAPERTQAIALGFPLKSARRTIANAAGRLTDLPVGFNASDGD